MQKSRKVNFKKKPNSNLNYLLNFNYQHYGDDSSYQVKKKEYGRRKNSKWNKEKSLELNYVSFDLTPFQKIVAKHKLSLCTKENVSVDRFGTVASLSVITWDDIFMIHKESKGKKCSICLDTFFYPRMSKCGHVFSAICLSRLLYHAEKSTMGIAQNKIGISVTQKMWITCPLCNSMFLSEECKRVKYTRESSNVSNGDTVSFTLMCRNDDYLEIHSLSEEKNTSRSKLSFLNTNDIVEIMNEEAVAFKNLLKIAQSSGDKEEAFHLERVLRGLALEKAKLLDDVVNWMPSISLNGTFSKEKFYQLSGSCKNVFLHPFNLKCLKHEEKYPDSLIDVKVLSVTKYDSINERFRKEHCFLGHLLPGSEVTFVEVDLKRYLSSSTIDFFKEAFTKRNEERRQQFRLNSKAEHNSKQKKSIKEDFQEQIEQLSQSPGFVGSELERNLLQVENSRVELREFLKSTYAGDGLGVPSETDTVKSFATVVHKNGYFPALSGTPSGTSKISAWGKATQKERMGHWPTLREEEVSTSPSQDVASRQMKSVRSKKSSRKQRVELFSTSGGRRYR